EYRKPAGSFDPASFGFAPSSLAVMAGYHYMPLMTFGGFSSGTNSNSTIATLGAQRSDFGTGFNRPFTQLSLVPTYDYLFGTHALRAGYEYRRQRWDVTVPPYGAGRYFFNGAYTRANNSAPLNDPAQMFAQFLLGLPTVQTGTVASAGSNSSQFEIASEGDWRQSSHALYVSDDWRVTSALTLSLNLRMEYATGMSEADDRAVAGFDRTVSSPIENAAKLKYAANPIPEIPVSQFAVKGGMMFADGPVYDSISRLMPRLGFAYQLGNKTIIRGGAGMFSYDYYFDRRNQTGLSP